jgi:hypothetical protein
MLTGKLDPPPSDEGSPAENIPDATGSIAQIVAITVSHCAYTSVRLKAEQIQLVIILCSIVSVG